MKFFLVALLLVFLLVIYFLPTIVASNRSHPNKMSIFIINLFLGCTLLGWVTSLAWACTHIRNEDKVKINEELIQETRLEPKL